MARYTSGNNLPLGHWNSLPIYLSTILTAVFVVGLIGSAILMSMGSPLLNLLVFAMPLEPGWTLWRLFTYVFVGPVSFFTPFAILFFYWVSVGIETHLGRMVLTRMLLLITLSTPALAALWWWGFGVPSDTFMLNNYLLMSGLLIAFATLYPNTEAWGWIPFKWIAFACVFCGSLMILTRHDWVGLSQLWAACAAGFAYTNHAREVEYDDHEPLLDRLKWWFRRRKFKVVKAAGAAPSRPVADRSTVATEEMDRLLDKIAKSGMSSLSAKERTQLEKARENLLRKDQP